MSLFKAIISIYLLATFSHWANAMSFGDFGKVCLFSNISGVITLDGTPVKNARLIRKVNFNREEIDEAKTDEEGYFEMPAIFKRTITKYLPQEFASSQEIHLIYKNQEYRIWSAVKREPDENSESRGKPLIVKCELSREEAMIIVNNSPIFSLCTWDVVADKRIKVF